jgi:uncharacterized protein (TIGR00369 family)
MKELPHTRSCFVCGEANPHGLNLRFHTDGRSVQARFIPGAEHSGFHRTVHGGLLATVLDEVMVWACAVASRRFGYCAEFNIRFLHPVRPGEPTLVTGELVTNRKNRIYEAKAQIQDESGRVLASATGKYLPLKGGGEGEPLVADVVGDISWVIGERG